jgi:hypothetical protein
MTQNKDKARQWDGKSRPTNDLYSKRWNEIFGKKKNYERLRYNELIRSRHEDDED